MPEQEEDEKTIESALLDQHPDVRARVLASGEFHAWKEAMPSVVVDDVRYYIRGGDMLRDLDQLVVEWAHGTGLLPRDPMGD